MKTYPKDSGSPRRMTLQLRRKLCPLLIALCCAPAAAQPLAPQVVNGQVTFAQQGNVFSITNSPGAIINWQSFSIKAGEVTRFIQQSSSSSVLNRITGQDPSQILGALQSNGRVFLINPNGILFGRDARIDVNGLVASSLNITNADFLAGRNKFAGGLNAGKVRNQGTITTPTGGQVYLIAPNVDNSGIITSPKGEVVLAAGHSVELADSATPGMHVVVSASADQAVNLGQIIAQGGKVGIYAALVNQRGIINANSAVVGENGKVVLKSSGTTLLEAGSQTTATGAGSGGEIHVLGDLVGLTGDAIVDASGRHGGGTVLIGGDYQGKNAALQNAQQAFVGKDAVIKADAIDSGNGGKVIVWGDQTAKVFGTISARGGAQSGDGGFIETSGHFLDVAGIRVDAGAANGKNGNWLLDPYDIYVGANNDSVSLPEVETFAAPSQVDQTSYINAWQISEAEANVTLQATHDITFAAEIDIVAAGVGLTAQAGNDIYVDASITTNGGALILSANDNGGGTATGSGLIVISPDVSLSGGAQTLLDANTLPTLNACVATPTLPSCSTVLPSLNACVATPTLPGCSVVLPSLNACIVNPASEGCSLVLPSLDACIFNPASEGCSAVLPSLGQCVANPALPGCTAVLPSLTACIASPASTGCSAVLPSVGQCVASPSLQGCSTVLPTMSQCVASPALAGCLFVIPQAQPEPGEPLGQALNTTVNLINTSTSTESSSSQTVMPPPKSAPVSEGATDDKKIDDKKDSPVLNDMQGKKDDHVKKTYCN